MRIIKKTVIAVFIIVFISAVAGGINIMQNGSRKWDGRTVDEILGVPAEKAAALNIETLSKSDVMQLFYAADAPDFQQMKGEYRAELVPVGILYSFNALYSHLLMGPGHWEGKSFFPSEPDKGRGYNLFSVNKNGRGQIVRTMKMDTFTGPSRFDGKPSFHLVYAAHNRGPNHSMRDEIRKINDRLYLGLGCLDWDMDTLNPTPFLLYGYPTPWVGPDMRENHESRPN